MFSNTFAITVHEAKQLLIVDDLVSTMSFEI